METEPSASLLKYVSPAWPARVGGIAIFLGSLLIIFINPSVPLYVPAITFVAMLLAVLFSAETTMIADRTSRTLAISKKRMINSTNISYPFDDIAFITQNITTSVNQKGETTKNVTYTLGLNSQTGTLPGYYQGRKPIPLPIPGSSFTTLSQMVGGVQKLARARELSNFIGVPFYMNGGENDTIVNAMEAAPQYLNALKNIPEAFAEAKKENEIAAREILGDKYPNQ